MSNRYKAIGALALAGAVAFMGAGGIAPRSNAEATVLQIGSSTYATGLSILNLDDNNDANIVVQAYTSSGSQPTGWPSGGISDIVPKGSTTQYFSAKANDKVFGNCTGCGNIPANSLVSLVVSSDRPIAASINTQRTGDNTLGSSGNPFRVGTANAVADTQAGSTIYLPQLIRNFANLSSRAYIQNTSSSAASVTFTFSDRNGNDVPGAKMTQSIPAFSSFELVASAVTGLADNSFYAVTATAADSTQKLAAVVNTFGTGADSGTSQLFSFNGESTGGTTLYAPKVDRKLGNSSLGFYTSGIVVQNVSAGANNISLSYVFANGQTKSRSYPGITTGNIVAEFLGNDNLFGDIANGTGALTVTCSAACIGIVNDNNDINQGSVAGASGLGQGATYNMLRGDTASKTAVIPQALKRVTADLGSVSGQYDSGIQYQNISSTKATCTVTFNSAGATVGTIASVSVDPGAAAFHYLPNTAEAPAGFNGGVKITCDQNIVAIGNYSAHLASNSNTAAGAGDTFTQNGGLNR